MFFSVFNIEHLIRLGYNITLYIKYVQKNPAVYSFIFTRFLTKDIILYIVLCL